MDERIKQRRDRSFVSLKATLNNVFNYIISVNYDGCLTLVNPDKQEGLLCFRQKKLVHASYQGKTGEAAIELLKQEPHWRFRFSADVQPESTELAMDYATFVGEITPEQAPASEAPAPTADSAPETPAAEAAVVVPIVKDAGVPGAEAAPVAKDTSATVGQVDTGWLPLEIQDLLTGRFSGDADIICVTVMYGDAQWAVAGGSSLSSADSVDAWKELIGQQIANLSSLSQAVATQESDAASQAIVSTDAGKIVIKMHKDPAFALGVVMEPGVNPAFLLVDLDHLVGKAAEFLL